MKIHMARALQADRVSRMLTYRDGGTGTLTGAVHFPLAVLVPLSRPEASRWVLVLP